MHTFCYFVLLLAFYFLRLGEGKRPNEFAEWNVERRAEWHNYAK